MNGPRIQQFNSELANCKQNGSTIENYYGRLNMIWDSLANYQPIESCRCGLCTCDLATKLEKKMEADKVHQFLYGLDEHFRAIRSSLVSRDPIQPLEEVYSIVNGEERTQTVAFVVQSKQQNRFYDKEKGTLCKHCNRTGHSSDNCFGVVGYPEWWGDKQIRAG